MHPCKLCKQEPSRTTGNDNVYCATNGCPMQGVWRPEVWNKLTTPDPYQSFVERLKADFPNQDINVDLWVHNTDKIYNVNFILWDSDGNEIAKMVTSITDEEYGHKTLDEAINQLGGNDG